MTIQQARDLAALLNAAADEAERAGRDTVYLAPRLQDADDAARAELERALAEAAKR